MKGKRNQTDQENTKTQHSENILQQAENKISESEHRFRALAENTFDIIVLLNPQGKPIYLNPALERTLGYKPEERIGGNGFEYVHPDDMKFLFESFVTLITNPLHPPIRGESRLRHKDGSWHVFETVGSALVHNNVLEAIIVNHRDITDRKKAEQLIRESEQRYRLLADNVTDGIFTIDLDFNYTYVSPSAFNIIGVECQDIVDKKSAKRSWTKFFDNRIAITTFHEHLKQFGGVHEQREHTAKDSGC